MASNNKKISTTINIREVQEKYGVPTGTVQPAYGVVVQPKYGVPTGTVQPAYGVPTGTIQPAYGVVVQPKYGVPTDTDISITYTQIEENISSLKKTISSLKTAWQTESKKNITRLQNSWVGEDCSAYTTKLTKMDTKVNNTISALELLCSTYEKARDMLKETQSKSLSAINSIE